MPRIMPSNSSMPVGVPGRSVRARSIGSAWTSLMQQVRTWRKDFAKSIYTASAESAVYMIAWRPRSPCRFSTSLPAQPVQICTSGSSIDRPRRVRAMKGDGPLPTNPPDTNQDTLGGSFAHKRSFTAQRQAVPQIQGYYFATGPWCIIH